MSDTIDLKRELHPAEIARCEAQAECARQEALSFAAEARRTSLQADSEALSLEVLRHQHQEYLAFDKFHHVYQFDQAVGTGTVKECIRQLATWTRQAGDEKVTVEIVLNSPGGAIDPGFALIDYIFYLRNQGHTVNTVAIGMCASMAAVILQAGSSRIIGRNATLLLHEGSLGAIGNYGEVKDRVKLMDMYHDQILNLFAARVASSAATKPLSKAAIKSRWSRTDWWVGADEAVKFGLVDAVR